jgi:hypothetical protein
MKALAAFLAVLGAALSARAADRSPSAEEIVRRLSGPPVIGLTRGLPEPRGVSVEAAATLIARPSIDLEVNFAFNSAAPPPTPC